MAFHSHMHVYETKYKHFWYLVFLAKLHLKQQPRN